MTPPGPTGPETVARRTIDQALSQAGWVLQDRDQTNLSASQGVAIREFKLASEHGYADYLLFVDGKAVGVVEAKPARHTLTGVEIQVARYATGLPPGLNPPVQPLPFLYQSTGGVTRFTNLLDPHPRSRAVFAFHRPETVAEWLQADTLREWARGWLTPDQVAEMEARIGLYGAKPSSLRGRLQTPPPVDLPGFWPNQVKAVENLERSLREDRPRALIQMATGSGKTRVAITALYRLIKFGGIRRAAFLVDRTTLGKQAEDEFAGYWTPDDRRKFTELYTVQRLTTNTIGASTKVVITTIQRLYSMLRGDPELPPELEQASHFEGPEDPKRPPVTVTYNSTIPPEYFDVVVVDECHRSIYTVWRQVLEYFDATIIGLTATPAKHTLGFFNQNLVMEYGHDKAVADGVNVDFEIYRIRTQITAQGSTIEANPLPILGKRDRRTRTLRWEAPDEDVTYRPEDLDRHVVAKDQIRLIARTFKEKLFTEIFPGRRDIPKTVVFAKDDSHAEDIVEIFREEFGLGNDFCQKITYRTTGQDPDQLIQAFRISYHPRIAVTVDMITTGTDIKPVELVLFMRAVKSRVLFEQMKGRGVRVIDPNELRAVTPDAQAKTHFVIVDCVGVTERADLTETQPMERKRTVSFAALLEHVQNGGSDPEILSSLASRLARLDRQCGPEERKRIQAVSGGPTLSAITQAIVTALDPDQQVEAARTAFVQPTDAAPTPVQLGQATEQLLKQAVSPLATKPALRKLLVDLKTQFEQIIDEVSQDALLEVGYSPEAKERARALVRSFEQFLADHRDEIEALQLFYTQPYRRRLRYQDLRALADTLKAPPRAWTPERLWQAYEALEKDRVRGVSGPRLLADVISLVRFALRQQDELVPYRDLVEARYQGWLTQQANRGRTFTPEQMTWLQMIKDHIATSVEISIDDLDYTPFMHRGGLGRARQVFGDRLDTVLQELNENLAA